MKKRLLVAVGLLAAVVVAVVFAFWPRGGTPVDKDDALDAFRSSEGGRGNASSDDFDKSNEPGDGRGSAAAPDAGVYTYSSKGQEIVKLGPLPAETRAFGASVVASVGRVETRDDSVCFDYELSLLVEHVEKTSYCASDGELTIDSHDKTMKMGPLTATATLTCSPKMVISENPSGDHECSLVLSGGPANVSADLVGTTKIGAVTQVPVGVQSVEAIPVTVSYNASGSVSGTWSEKIWMAAGSWLPLKLERDIALAGPANITEKSSLELTDLSPSR